MKKKEVTQKIHTYLDSDCFEGSLEKIIETIKGFKDKINQEYLAAAKSELSAIIPTNPKLFHRLEVKWGYNYGESKEPMLYGVRMETDAEFKERKRKSEQAAINAKQSAITKRKNKRIQEEKEYLRLKAKFDKSKN